jgi:uncharacterized protein
MRLTQDPSSSIKIRAYAAGELRINEELHRDSLIVAPTAVVPQPDLKTIADLGAAHFAQISVFEPELVLIGTGRRQEFPAPEFGARFLASGIGFEVMDTGAACRTFNVLVGEHRRVVALLIL